MSTALDRRSMLAILTTTMAGLASRSALAVEPQIKVATHTYKRVGNLEIKADVHRADDARLKPVLVWIHGGALIMGHRGGIDRRVKQRMLDAGYVIVSIDYRLAPETQLPEIIGDLEDAFAWIRSEGPRQFAADTRRIAVMGGSAGGYLTLTSGFRVRPRPSVLVSFFGYGDLIGDWYSQPSPHARHNRFPITERRANAQVTGPPISDARDREGDGGVFYNYCRQRGLWPKKVSGWDPQAEAEKFYPYMAVRNVTADYPPTVLIHGTADTDVPYEQSVMMAVEFKKHGVEHQFISIADGEHGFGGGDPSLIEQAYQSAFEFVDRNMRE